MVQASLVGVWRVRVDGCPHYHGRPEGPAACELNEMRTCELEVGNPCQIFREIVTEWEKELCPECLQFRPGDERVANGMKCGICAGYADRSDNGKSDEPK